MQPTANATYTLPGKILQLLDQLKAETGLIYTRIIENSIAAYRKPADYEHSDTPHRIRRGRLLVWNSLDQAGIAFTSDSLKTGTPRYYRLAPETASRISELAEDVNVTRNYLVSLALIQEWVRMKHR